MPLQRHTVTTNVMASKSGTKSKGNRASCFSVLSLGFLFALVVIGPVVLTAGCDSDSKETGGRYSTSVSGCYK
jgi:hypothetical protein